MSIPFRARYGESAPIPRDEVPNTAVEALYFLIERWREDGYLSGSDELLAEVAAHTRREAFNDWDDLRYHLLEMNWLDFYSFCEYILSHHANDPPRIASDLNHLFAEERLSFRVEGVQVVGVESAATAMNIERSRRALDDPRLAAAKQLFEGAQAQLQSSEPNTWAVVMGAVKAVEAVAKTLGGHKRSLTMKEVMPKWTGNGPGQVKHVLSKVFAGLYAYRGDSSAHGESHLPPPSLVEAEFVLSTAAACIVFLSQLERERQPETPI